jgi:hypothetical protein
MGRDVIGPVMPIGPRPVGCCMIGLGPCLEEVGMNGPMPVLVGMRGFSKGACDATGASGPLGPFDTGEIAGAGASACEGRDKGVLTAGVACLAPTPRLARMLSLSDCALDPVGAAGLDRLAGEVTGVDTDGALGGGEVDGSWGLVGLLLGFGVHASSSKPLATGTVELERRVASVAETVTDGTGEETPGDREAIGGVTPRLSWSEALAIESAPTWEGADRPVGLPRRVLFRPPEELVKRPPELLALGL